MRIDQMDKLPGISQLRTWTVDDVTNWLHQVSLSECVNAFQDHEIDGLKLANLKEKQLRSMRDVPKNKYKTIMNFVKNIPKDRIFGNKKKAEEPPTVPQRDYQHSAQDGYPVQGEHEHEDFDSDFDSEDWDDEYENEDEWGLEQNVAAPQMVPNGYPNDDYLEPEAFNPVEPEARNPNVPKRPLPQLPPEPSPMPTLPPRMERKLPVPPKTPTHETPPSRLGPPKAPPASGKPAGFAQNKSPANQPKPPPPAGKPKKIWEMAKQFERDQPQETAPPPPSRPVPKPGGFLHAQNNRPAQSPGVRPPASNGFGAARSFQQPDEEDYEAFDEAVQPEARAPQPPGPKPPVAIKPPKAQGMVKLIPGLDVNTVAIRDRIQNLKKGGVGGPGGIFGAQNTPDDNNNRNVPRKFSEPMIPTKQPISPNRAAFQKQKSTDSGFTSTADRSPPIAAGSGFPGRTGGIADRPLPPPPGGSSSPPSLPPSRTNAPLQFPTERPLPPVDRPLPPVPGGRAASPPPQLLARMQAPPVPPPTSSTIPRGPGRVADPTNRPLPAPPQFEEETSIYSFPWYYGDYERKEASAKIESYAQEGIFLVRKSTKGGPSDPYTLMFHDGNKIHNLHIRRRDDNTYALGNKKDNEMTFHSVPELIRYHQTHPIALAGGARSTLTTSPPKGSR